MVVMVDSGISVDQGAVEVDEAADKGEAIETVGRSSLLPDPRRILDILLRRIWIFLAVLVPIVGLAATYAAIAPRKYEAVSRVLIEPQRADPIKPVGTVEQGERSRDADFIETQILLVSSPEISRAAAQALNLVNDPDFGGAAPQLRPEDRMELTVRKLRAETAIRRVGQTSLVEIAAQTRSPTLSAQIANEIAKQYLSSIDTQRSEGSRKINTQIDAQLTELRAKTNAADAALQQYKIAHGLMSAEGATMAEQESSTLNQQIAAARATLAQAQGRLAAARRQIASGGGGADTTSALSSGTIGALRQSEADSSRTLAQLRTRYGPKHPSVALEEQRLADIRSQIQKEIDRIQSSLQAEVNVAASGLSSLESSQSQSRARLAGNAAAQTGLLELQRNADAAKTIYEAFLNTSRGAAARNGIDPPVASLSSTAVPPTTASSPNVLLIYFFGLLFGLLGGAIAVFVSEIFDSGIRSRSDIEHRLGARYLGAVPDLRLGNAEHKGVADYPEAYVVTHPLSAFTESVRSLRAAVTLARRRRPKVLALTSALPQEGKTTTTMCLARVMAMSGASTVLVDLDLRRHSSSTVLLGGREGRLLEVLGGKLAMSDALVKDEATELMILGVTQDMTQGSDPLTPEALASLLAELRERFDYIVLDTGPLLGVADARTAAKQADAVVLLARWRRTSMRSVDAALDLLISVGAKVAGVALTQVNVAKFGSSRDELYGYQKQFKGYYTN